ncbi:MAG: TonB-dependent receptor [Bacteroidales bacterium]|jgi:hemoglobin/transferrin/lactoferrin receptor protein|nr:TonB-dependent receptor [Bacteroidales bacterium]
MKKQYILLLVIVMSVFGAHTQTVKVLDWQRNSPLEFVTINSTKAGVSALTTQAGTADISMFKDADSIFFSRLGHQNIVTSWQSLLADNFVIYMRESNYSLDEVVISATRWAQPRKELTSRVTTIRPEEIEIDNPQTTADLLGMTGEVFIQKSQQGGGSPMIRGFATNRLLISVDGVRMNTAIFRSGNIQNIINIDPYTIEQAEVLYGPGSVMYGSDAIGGVMNFTTLNPRFSADNKVITSGRASTRYSSANEELSSHIHVNVGGKKWAAVSSFSFNRFGDLRMGSNGPDFYLRKEYVKRIDGVDVVVQNDNPEVQVPSGFEMGSFMQKISYRPNDNWEFQYGFNYSTTTDYDRYDRLLRYRKGAPRSAEWYYGPQNWMMNRFTVIHKQKRKLFDQMVLNLSYQLFEESRHDRDFGKTALSERFEKVNAYGINLDLMKKLSDRSKFLYGGEIVLNKVISTGLDTEITDGTSVKGPARYPDSDWLSAAVFATYQYQLTEKTLVQAGARYNYVSLNADFDTTFYKFPFQTSSTNNGALTGSLGLNYTPDERWILRAGLSTGFRAPNVDDVGKVFDSEPGSVVVPNPNLRPEYAYNAEIDVAHIFADRLKLDVSAFYTLLDQAMVRRDFTFNGQDSILYDGEMSKVQAIQNASQAIVYGLQLAAEWKMDNGFSIFSHLTWQQGEEELDDGSKGPLRHSAPLFGITRLSYMSKGLRLDLYAHYANEVPFGDMPKSELGKTYLYPADADGNIYSPGWYTLNFKVMKQISETFSLTGGVENITDQRYMPYSSGLVSPGRNFIFSLNMKF